MKVSELPYKTLGIKLKDPTNREHIDTIKKSFRDRLHSLGYDKEDYYIKDII